MRNILVLLAVGLAAVAAAPSNPQRIVGGSVTTIQQYPDIVALLYAQFGILFSQSCGGIILNARSILTAAHCPVGDRASSWRARIGSTRSNSGGVVYNFNSFILHPHFIRRTLDNDVAIMRTSTLIVYNSGAQPAAIAGPNYILGDHQVVWAAGWGATSSGGSSSVQLRHVQIWTVNHRICVERYARVNQIVTENMLCSGWLDVGGRDQCQGDSGGPLYHNRVVVGVSSWGRRCGLPEFPGVNVRVTRVSHWIQLNA